jgi:hypothetical protein
MSAPAVTDPRLADPSRSAAPSTSAVVALHRDGQTLAPSENDRVATDGDAASQPRTEPAAPDPSSGSANSSSTAPRTSTDSGMDAADVIVLDELLDVSIWSHLWTRRHQMAITGVFLSLLVHLWLLGGLSQVLTAVAGRWDPSEVHLRFENKTPLEEPLQTVISYELAEASDRELPQVVTTFAASLGLAQAEDPKREAPLVKLDIVDPVATRRPVFDIPEGRQVSQTLVVPGTTGEGVVQLDAALDRITVEIARHLQEQRVLVVWLLDASGSLTAQRKAVSQRLRKVYGELQALEQSDQFGGRDEPLLSGVVSFGAETQFLTKRPTPRFDDFAAAFDQVVTDPTGTERVFSAINLVLERWQHYRSDQNRRILLITITDEAGDDHGRPLDLAISRCRRIGAVGYVIGPAAPFGRRQGFVPYVAPEDGRTYSLPVDLGPESVVVETVDLPYWYDGPQYEHLSSGYGPYALSRFVHETGGVYFLTNMTTMAGLATVGRFDAQRMKQFEPDYSFGEPNEFLADVAKHPVRQAVFQAAQHSQTTSLRTAGTPQLEFALTPQNFRNVLTEAQRSAAVTHYAVEAILSKMPAEAAKRFDREPSARWRLMFLLNYGRLLAQKVRSVEYNSACAQLKTSYTEQDIATRVNRLSFRPDRELHYAMNLRRDAQTAQSALQRVIADAPGTPWSILAQRELKDGFGIRVVERYIPPPPPPKPEPMPPQNQPKRPKFAPEPPPPQAPQAPKPKPVLPRL